MTPPDWPTWADIILKVFAAIGGLVGTAGGLAVMLVKSTFVTKDHLQEHIDAHAEVHDELAKRLAKGEQQFAEIKVNLEHLPDHKDIAEVKDRIGKVQVEVRGLAESINGLHAIIKQVERPLNLLVEHHMKGDK